ncbi:hypothetical protein C1H46_034866 [Malus baccata]|uniref:F-box domain-containing protein n=1 Tax=Malus baccata TaxID=106549 RepID=A0A540KZE9_MALBA|nr:hypothetical protein C1H46_034866 [Malus baccata]
MEERGQMRDWMERRPISNKKTPNFPETLTLPRPGSSHSNPSAPIDQDEMKGVGFSNIDDNLIFEVFKHVDARTLGMASSQQLRYVVLTLGGFWRLHTHYIWHLSKVSSSSSFVPSFSSVASSSTLPWATAPGKSMLNLKPSSAKWGKDEVNMLLSLFLIRFYKKMNYARWVFP